MLALLLTLSVGAVAIAPRALPNAETIVFVPRIDRTESTLPFFRAAGARTAMLRPEAWREASHPLLNFDLTSRDSLASAGIDAAGPLTLSRRGTLEASCVALADVKVYTDACDARLVRLGELFRKTDKAGVTVVGARDVLGRVLAAYAVKGKESCALSGGPGGLGVERVLPDLIKALTLPPKSQLLSLATNLPGAALFVRPEGRGAGALSLAAEGLTLTADARTTGLPLPRFSGAGPSPFATLSPPGLGTLRLRVQRDALPGLISALETSLPCGAALGPTARALAPLLTGNVAVFAHSVRVTTGLRTPEARFFALKFTMVAEVGDAARAAALVKALDPAALQSREGTLEAGVLGSTVWLSNDRTSREVALAALPASSGRQAHGAELSATPTLVARALGQVPLLEAVQTPELAGLLAVSVELGPLLLQSERITGWLDQPQGGVARAQATWSVRPLAALDGGAP